MLLNLGIGKMYMKRGGPTPFNLIFPQDPPKIGWGKMRKKQAFVLKKLAVY